MAKGVKPDDFICLPTIEPSPTGVCWQWNTKGCGCCSWTAFREPDIVSTEQIDRAILILNSMSHKIDVTIAGLQLRKLMMESG
jgi:hypothetical protein